MSTISDGLPFFSVVVPTQGRPEQLRACLASLANSDYPAHQFEVIVVNDGGPPALTEDLAAVNRKITLLWVDQTWAGPAAARNNGASRARGAYIAFTDDDCVVAPDWLSALDTTIRAHPDALVGGRTINALSDNRYATASQMLVDYLYGYYHAGASRGQRFFTSNNWCVATTAFRDLGGFDASFTLAAGEDREFCGRWFNAQRPFHYASDVIVHHRHGLTFRSFTRQHLNYGRGARSLHLARARRGEGRPTVEPWTFYRRLVAFPLADGWAPGALALSGLMVWSQVLNVTGYFLERANGSSLSGGSPGGSARPGRGSGASAV